jgi:hypothetical protein
MVLGEEATCITDFLCGEKGKQTVKGGRSSYKIIQNHHGEEERKKAEWK